MNKLLRAAGKLFVWYLKYFSLTIRVRLTPKNRDFAKYNKEAFALDRELDEIEKSIS